MKSFSRRWAFSLALGTIALCGCHKVKPVVLLPQQPPPSTRTESPTDQSPADTSSANAQTQPPAANPPTDQTATANASQAKPERTKPRHHPSAAQRNTPQPPTGTGANGKPPAEVAKNTAPPKITVPEGSTDTRVTSGQISPVVSHNETIHGTATTDQLLESTDTNLRSITKRQLSSDEQSILAQINDYITQSHQATKDGDLVRAHNLALKAHLLSDDLAKSR